MGGSANTIGGTAAGAGNLISGNDQVGLDIDGETGDLVEGNLIGTNLAGTAAVPNDYAIMVRQGSTHVTVGGTTAAARNVVSGNTLYGIYIKDPGTTDNLVEGNYVGTDKTGTVALPNDIGVQLQASGGGNTIGGTTATPGTGAGNLIAGNSGHGIFATVEPTQDMILGNVIGLSSGGTASPTRTV